MTVGRSALYGIHARARAEREGGWFWGGNRQTSAVQGRAKMID